MTKKATKKIEKPVMCSRWPRCKCVAQGYVNYGEPNYCGRKPKTRSIRPRAYANYADRLLNDL